MAAGQLPGAGHENIRHLERIKGPRLGDLHLCMMGAGHGQAGGQARLSGYQRTKVQGCGGAGVRGRAQAGPHDCRMVFRAPRGGG